MFNKWLLNSAMPGKCVPFSECHNLFTSIDRFLALFQELYTNVNKFDWILPNVKLSNFSLQSTKLHNVSLVFQNVSLLVNFSLFQATLSVLSNNWAKTELIFWRWRWAAKRNGSWEARAARTRVSQFYACARSDWVAVTKLKIVTGLSYYCHVETNPLLYFFGYFSLLPFLFPLEEHKKIGEQQFYELETSNNYGFPWQIAGLKQ